MFKSIISYSGLLAAVFTLSASIVVAAPPQIEFIADAFGNSSASTSCVAPCYVHFTAQGMQTDGSGNVLPGANSRDAESARPFHELEYRWNFGDAGSGTLRTGFPANSALGPIAGHMYETPGTYQVTLVVTDTDGESSSSSDTTITVLNPVSHFVGRTYCVTRGNSVGSWCPSGATALTNQTSFSAALNSSPNVRNAKPWVVMNCGENWPASSSVTLSSSAGRALLSSRDGAGNVCSNRPRIHYTGGGIGGGSSGWTISGLTFDGPDTFGGYDKAIQGGGVNGLVVHRVEVVGASGGTIGINGIANRLAAWGNTLSMSPNGDDTGTNLFWSGPNQALMNNLIDNNEVAEFGLRTSGGVQNFLLSDNEWTRPGYNTGRNHIQIRGTDAATVNGNVVISRNLFVSHGNSIIPFLRFCRDSGCHGYTGPTMRNILVESNHMRYDRPAIAFPSGAMVASRAADVTVRNNTFDIRGLPNSSGTVVMCDESFDDWASSSSHDNLHCYNNTLYTDDNTPARLRLCAAANGDGHRCYNNLVYAPSVSGTYTVYSSSWVGGGNVRAVSSPFGAAVSAANRFQTTGREFQLSSADTQAANQAININTNANIINSLRRDFNGCRRQTPYDVGAHERGASDCGASGGTDNVSPAAPTALQIQ